MERTKNPAREGLCYVIRYRDRRGIPRIRTAYNLAGRDRILSNLRHHPDYPPVVVGVPDEPRALKAVGLCGGTTRCWKVCWTEDGRGRARTASSEEKACAHLAEARLVDPAAEVHREGWRYCHQIVPAGDSACRNHGGKAPKGPACHTFRTGDRSKMFGGAYAERYRAAVAEEVVDLRHELAGFAAREGDLLEAIEARRQALGGYVQAWERLRDLLSGLRAAIEDDAPGPDLLEHLGEVEALASEGVGLGDAWEEWLKLAERRARVVDIHAKATERSADSLRSSEFLAIAAQVVELAREVIRDKSTLTDFTAGMARIAEGASGGRRWEEPRGEA